MNHLAEAQARISEAEYLDPGDEAQVFNCAQIAIAHVLIAICERLPPLAETWSEGRARLRQEEQDEL